jgi:hypothetical protein
MFQQGRAQENDEILVGKYHVRTAGEKAKIRWLGRREPDLFVS